MVEVSSLYVTKGCLLNTYLYFSSSLVDDRLAD